VSDDYDDERDCPGCIVDAEYPVGMSGTHTCRPTEKKEPSDADCADDLTCPVIRAYDQGATND